MNRRSMIKLSSAAVVGAALITQTACEKRDVDFYVTTITGSMAQLKPLLPSQVILLDKAISIAKSVNQAYQDGKFKDAQALAINLTTTINEVIAAAGVNLNDTVKMILSIANVALGTIAVLIKRSAPAGAMAGPALSVASSARVNAIFEAARL